MATRWTLLTLLLPALGGCGGRFLEPPMPGPPPSPAGEATGPADALLVSRCAARMQALAAETRQRITRVVVTQSAPWGTIWRADAIDSQPQPAEWRIVCWGEGKVEGVTISPLVMFDPSRNIAPLPAE